MPIGHPAHLDIMSHAKLRCPSSIVHRHRIDQLSSPVRVPPYPIVRIVLGLRAPPHTERLFLTFMSRTPHPRYRRSPRLQDVRSRRASAVRRPRGRWSERDDMSDDMSFDDSHYRDFAKNKLRLALDQ